MADSRYDAMKHASKNSVSKKSIASIAGTATDAQKETVIGWHDAIVDHFGGNIMRKVAMTRYDVDDIPNVPTAVTGSDKSENKGKDAGNLARRAELVCEFTVDKDMISGYGTMHGGCIAYLADTCTSIALTAFSPMHVSVSLNVEFHQPISLGTTVEVISTTKGVGKRMLFTKCEVRNLAPHFQFFKAVLGVPSKPH